MGYDVADEDWGALMEVLNETISLLEGKQVEPVKQRILEFSSTTAMLGLEDLANVGNQFEAFLMTKVTHAWDAEAAATLGFVMGALVEKMQSQQYGAAFSAGLDEVLLYLSFFEQAEPESLEQEEEKEKHEKPGRSKGKDKDHEELEREPQPVRSREPKESEAAQVAQADQSLNFEAEPETPSTSLAVSRAGDVGAIPGVEGPAPEKSLDAESDLLDELMDELFELGEEPLWEPLSKEEPAMRIGAVEAPSDEPSQPHLLDEVEWTETAAEPVPTSESVTRRPLQAVDEPQVSVDSTMEQPELDAATETLPIPPVSTGPAPAERQELAPEPAPVPAAKPAPAPAATATPAPASTPTATHAAVTPTPAPSSAPIPSSASAPSSVPAPTPSPTRAPDHVPDPTSDMVCLFREMLRHDPASRVFVSLAEELCSRQMWAEAVETCRRGLAVHPQIIRARVLLGLALWNSGKGEAAEHELTRARLELEKNSLLYGVLAEIADSRGAWDDALHFRNVHGVLKAIEGQVTPVAGPVREEEEPALSIKIQESPAMEVLRRLLDRFDGKPVRAPAIGTIFSQDDRQALKQLLSAGTFS